MSKKKPIIPLILFILINLITLEKVFAQWGNEASINYYRHSHFGLSLFQSYFAYEEPGVMNEKGFNGGISGELGFNLHPSVSVSVEGSNWDGTLVYTGATFAGVPVQTKTEDYVSDYRLFLHLLFDSFNFSVGFGQRHWLNDLVVSYRRRTEYQYAPIKLTYFFQSYYASFEYDLWLSGKNTSYMSDVGGGRSDVLLKQNSGSGLGAEMGWIIPSYITTKIFLTIHKWDVKASDIAFDGVDFLVEPDNNTLTVNLGLGVIF